MTVPRSGKPRRGASPRSSLDPIEIASRDEIAALQLKRLRSTLKQSYDQVPHYRAKCEAAGVHPDDCRTLDDLARFPFTAKADLRDTFPYGMFAVPREQVARLHASSGTTGTPTVVGYTRRDLDHWADLVARSIRAAGGRAGDLVQVAYGYGLFTGGLGAHYGAERLGCTVVPMSGGQTEKQVQFIRELRPDILMCTPSYALVIADEFRRLGIDPSGSSLAIGIHGAEPWTEAMRSEIETSFAMDALDIYGLSEVMGPGVASECVEAKDGLVVWEDHFYPEIIDPDTGAVLPDGSPGELVFTSLTREAMPVVRYRTRDLSVLLPGTARSMRRLGRIGGRSDDMLIVRGVNLFPSQLEGLILEAEIYAPHYLLELRREGRLDTLAVVVEPRDDGVSTEVLTHAAHTLVHRIKTMVGVSVTVRHEPPGGVPRSAGKAKRVVDLR